MYNNTIQVGYLWLVHQSLDNVSVTSIVVHMCVHRLRYGHCCVTVVDTDIVVTGVDTGVAVTSSD